MKSILRIIKYIFKREPSFLTETIFQFYLPYWINRKIPFLLRYKKIILFASIILNTIVFLTFLYYSTIFALIFLIILALVLYLFIDFIGLMALQKKDNISEKELIELINQQSATFINYEHYFSRFNETLFKVKNAYSGNNELLIGHFDTDGRVYSEFGNLPFQLMVSKSEFVNRTRYPMSIVIKEGLVLVKKEFRTNKKAFVNELLSVLTLPNGIKKPHIHSFDFKNFIIYKSLIFGNTLRNIIVENGGKILNVDTDKEFNNSPLSEVQKINLILSRGTKIIKKLINENQFLKFENEIKKIHHAGITNLSLTFGNIICEEKTGDLVMIDFESTIIHKKRTILFHYLKNNDLKKYNNFFDRNLLTDTNAQELINKDSSKFSSFYASINFGNGFFIGPFWDKESGIGRWNFFNKNILPKIVYGKRILDMGTNNSYLSLLLLKEGMAKEIVCVERDPIFIERANLVRKIFDWQDDYNYPISIIEGDMVDFSYGKFGYDFDILTFFCSIYYLDEENIINLLTYASKKIPELIIQANDGTRKQATENKSYKSSTNFLIDAIKKSGYEIIKTHYGKGFSRPIIHAKSKSFNNY
ncbi:MAG: hypothetical protein IT243_02690 [Bacteroidia bacterium]|nr:hypothetical protein [Bacteroidia bacterium]